MATERQIVFRIKVKDFEKLFESFGDLEKSIVSTNKELKKATDPKQVQELKTELAALKAAQKQVNTEIRVQTKLFEGLKQSENSFKKIKAEADFLKDTLKGLGKDTDLDEFKKRIEELLPSTKKLGLETLDLGETQKALAKQIISNETALKEFNKSISANAQVLEFAEGSYKKLQQQTKELSKESRLLGDNLPDDELKKLQNRLEEIDPQLKKYDLSSKNLQATKDILSKQIKENNSDLSNFNRSLSASDELVGEYSRGILNAFGKVGLTDSLEKGLKSLNIEKEKLTKQLTQAIKMYDSFDDKGSQAAKDIRREIDRLNKSIDNTDNKIDDVNKSLSKTAVNTNKQFSKLNGTLKTGLGLLTAQIGFNGIDGVIDDLKAITDAESDVQKNTDLTSEAVRRLRDNLKEIDTRTAEIELTKIASIGGKLGIIKPEVDTGDIEAATEKLFQFTKGIDVLNVAVGDAFNGSAEKVTEVFAGLNNVLTDNQTGDITQDILRIGNAFNFVEKQGKISISVMADLTNRIAGAGIPIGLTTQQVIGLAGTLSELEITAERGGTAIINTLSEVAKSPAKFADAIGVNAGEFRELVETDILGALKLVLENSNKLSSNVEVAQFLEKMKLSGSAVQEVFQKLSVNSEKLDDRIRQAGTGLEGTGDIMAEFEVKNKNLAATLDKTKNELKEIFTSTEFIESAEDAADVVLVLAQNVGGLAKVMIDNKEIVATVVGAYGLYRAILLAVATQQRLNVIQTKALGVANASHAISTNAVRAAYFALTGQMAAARVASTALKASLATNPFTAILLGLTIIVPLLVAYSKNSEKIVIVNEKLRDSNRSLNEQTTERINKIEAERTAANTLLEAIKKNIDNRDISKRLITEFNTKYGSYLGNLDAEKISLKELETLQDNLNKKLLQKQIIVSFESEINELLKKQAEAAKAVVTAGKERAKLLTTNNEIGFSPSQLGAQDDLLKDFETVNQNIIDGTDAAVKEVQDDYKKLSETLGLEFGNILKAIGGATGAATTNNKNSLKVFEDSLNDAAGVTRRTVGVIKEEINDLNKAIENATSGGEVLEIQAQIKIKESELKGILDPKSNESVKGSINAINKEISDLNEKLKDATDTAARDEIRVKIKVEENALKEIENENKEKQIVLPVRIEILDEEINDLKEKLNGASEQERFQILGEIKLKQEEKEKLEKDLENIKDFEINLKIKANEQDLKNLESELLGLEDKEIEIKTRITQINETIDSAQTIENATGVPLEGFDISEAQKKVQDLQEELNLLGEEKAQIEIEVKATGTENFELEKELSEQAQKEITDSRFSEEQKRQAKAQELREDAFKLLENEAQKEIIQAQNFRQQKLNELSQALANEEITQEQYNQQLEQLEKDHQDSLAQIQLDELNGKASFVQDASVEYLQLVKEINDAEYQEHKKNEDRKREDIKKTVNFESEMQNARLDLIGTFVSGAKELLGQDEQNRRKYANVIKALAVGEIALNLIREISAISANPLNELVPGLKAVKIVAAIAKAGVSTVKVLNQKFKKGGVINGKTPVGQTTDNGYIDSQGVAHGQRHKDSDSETGGIGIVVGGKSYEIEDKEMIVQNGSEIIILNRNVGIDAASRQKVWSIRDNINLTPQQKKEKLSKINEASGGDSFVKQSSALSGTSWSIKAPAAIPMIKPRIHDILGPQLPIPYGIIEKTLETHHYHKQVIESNSKASRQLGSDIKESVETMHKDVSDAVQAINNRIDNIEVNLSVSNLSITQAKMQADRKRFRI